MSEQLHQYVLEKLEAAKGTWPAVAEGSGVSLRTIEKIARQETKDPRISGLQKIADFFRKRDRRQAAA